MKITRVEIYKANIPLAKTFRIAIGQTDVANNIFVKIETDGSLYGMGEASPFTPIVGETQASALAVARDLAGLLIGRDPCDIEGALRLLTGYMKHNKTMLSAFDMALYDILGKAAGLPIYTLLAGGKRTLFTDRTIGIDTPDKMVEEAIAYKEQGLPAIKVKLGTTVAEDIERIRRLRVALGPQLSLRIDANQGWDRIGASQALREMEDKGIQYCEQPVAAWDFESMSKIALQTTIPIMADESLFDEHDAYKLIACAACDCFNIKLAKSGGIHVALKINAIAESAGMWCMIGCMSETRLGLTAAAHLASARPNIRYADLDSAHLLTVDPVIGGITYGACGAIELPDSPGLGAAIDPSLLASLESFVVE